MELKLENLEEFTLYACFFLVSIILFYNFNFNLIFLFSGILSFFFSFFYKNYKFFLFFVIGFLSCFIRMQNLKFQSLNEKEVTSEVGIIEKTYFKSGGIRALMQFEGYNFKVIASFKEEEDINYGEKLWLSGKLIPLPKKVYPYFYDVETKNKFQNIGAYFSVEEFEKLSNKTHILAKPKKYVLNIINKIKNTNAQGIVTALALGDKGKIEQQDYEIFRKSGLAHLLAISGLHISIYVVLIFNLFYKILALTSFCLKYNTQKIAAILGLLFGLFYLFLANFPVSGIRSFIMVLCLFCNYIFYRGSFGVRSLIIAMFIILTIWPEEVIFPSFQLSFVAVLCLLKSEFFVYNIKNKYLKSLFQTIISSFVVSVITLPFSAHHFSYWHFYGAFSNIFAIPFLALIIMPLLIFSIAFNSEFLLNLLEYCILFLLKFASFFASLPFSAIHFNYFNGFLLTIFTFAIILIFCVKHYKTIGFGMLILSLSVYIFIVKKPFLVVNQSDAVFLHNEQYYTIYNIKSKFLKEIWEQKLNAKFIPKNKSKICKNGLCINETFVLIYAKPKNLNKIDFKCGTQIYVNIFSNKQYFNCNFKKIITLKDLEEKGITPFVF